MQTYEKSRAHRWDQIAQLILSHAQKLETLGMEALAWILHYPLSTLFIAMQSISSAIFWENENGFHSEFFKSK